MINNTRLNYLEKTIVKKGYSKVFKMRSLKDMIIYYDMYENPELDGPVEEPPYIEDCLPPDLRQMLKDFAAKHPDDDEELEEEEEEEDKSKPDTEHIS